MIAPQGVVQIQYKACMSTILCGAFYFSICA